MELVADTPLPEAIDLQSAYAWCRDYTRAHQENFTVVSWLLPRDLRPHFHALYAFCRWTDDLGDKAEGDRLALLGRWETGLRECLSGQRSSPLFLALGATIDRFQIPGEPFLHLIEANRLDQRKVRFDTYDKLLSYCQYSAAPVGRLVLYVLGYRDKRRQELSDATCIALQLTNFWQDAARDFSAGRVYIPQEDLRRFGVDEDEIAAGRAGPAFRRMIEFEVGRARQLFRRGRELETMVDRRARLDVRLFRLGGEATLAAIEEAGYDVLSARPSISGRRKAWVALSSGVRLKLGF